MQTRSTLFKSILFALTGGLARLGFAADAVGASPASQTLYPAGSQQSFKGPEAYFTGDVQVDMLFPGNDTAHYSGAYVTFQPGARTAWHLHPAGQHMIVTNGVARTGSQAIGRGGRHSPSHLAKPMWQFCGNNFIRY
ncbi:MAG: hypothetical protein WCH04_21055 [Gammaproteobacteria bacterium]